MDTHEVPEQVACTLAAEAVEFMLRDSEDPPNRRPRAAIEGLIDELLRRGGDYAAA